MAPRREDAIRLKAMTIPLCWRKRKLKEENKPDTRCHVRDLSGGRMTQRAISAHRTLHHW